MRLLEQRRPASRTQVHEEALTSSHRCLVLASDGVWSFLTSQEAVDICERHRERGAASASQALVNEAAKRWADKEGPFRDDITALVLLLRDGRPAPSVATIAPSRCEALSVREVHPRT